MLGVGHIAKRGREGGRVGHIATKNVSTVKNIDLGIPNFFHPALF